MRQRATFATLLTATLLMTGVAARAPGGQEPADKPPLAQDPPPYSELGLASYYGADFHSLPTASGERFDMDRMTAAHRSLPFGTRVRVTNLSNGRSAVVRINDRGPFVKGRVVDVSHAAARKLRLLARGTGRVRVEVLPSRSQRPSGESG